MKPEESYIIDFTFSDVSPYNATVSRGTMNLSAFEYLGRYV